MTGDDCRKVTVYFGERDRAGNASVADALVDLFARHEVATSAVFRGIMGFGAKHRLQTARLLSLSEDLPLVATAVDRTERIEGLLGEATAIAATGLVTLERARLLTGRLEPESRPSGADEQAKLTVYVGRRERAGGRPAHEAVVALLHEHAIAGATVLLGIDGTAHGVRRRASLVGRNQQVPLMIISVGDADAIARVLADLDRLLERPLVTLERVQVLRRDGRRLAAPRAIAATDDAGRALWGKVMAYASEQSRHNGRPLHETLVRRLRADGAPGATVLRGLWGYHGDHRPHGERLWALGRHVPVVTVMIDSVPDVLRRMAIVDDVTAETGLVTLEAVPALRAVLPGSARGGLNLADPDSG